MYTVDGLNLNRDVLFHGGFIADGRLSVGAQVLYLVTAASGVLPQGYSHCSTSLIPILPAISIPVLLQLLGVRGQIIGTSNLELGAKNRTRPISNLPRDDSDPSPRLVSTSEANLCWFFR